MEKMKKIRFIMKLKTNGNIKNGQRKYMKWMANNMYPSLLCKTQYSENVLLDSIIKCLMIYWKIHMNVDRRHHTIVVKTPFTF
jgi:hypothetical protein